MYMSSRRAEEIINKCMTELYASASPPAVWSELKIKYANSGITFYKRHYLDWDTAEEILMKHKRMLPVRFRGELDMVFLNLCPTSRKEDLDE